MGMLSLKRKLIGSPQLLRLENVIYPLVYKRSFIFYSDSEVTFMEGDVAEDGL